MAQATCRTCGRGFTFIQRRGSPRVVCDDCRKCPTEHAAFDRAVIKDPPKPKQAKLGLSQWASTSWWAPRGYSEYHLEPVIRQGYEVSLEQTDDLFEAVCPTPELRELRRRRELVEAHPDKYGLACLMHASYTRTRV